MGLGRLHANLVFLTKQWLITFILYSLGVDYLFESVCNPAFKPWEIHDLGYRFDVDAASLKPCQRAEDLLYKAAFRDGLGNSLFSPDYKVRI